MRLNGRLTSSGGGGGGAPVIPVPPYPSEYDYIVNSAALAGAEYTGKFDVLGTLQDVLIKSQLDGITNPKIRIDEDIVEVDITIPPTVTEVSLYSPGNHKVTANFLWSNTGAGYHTFKVHGVNITDNMSNPLFNFDSFTSGRIDLQFVHSEIETEWPLIPPLAGSTLASRIDFTMHDCKWTHDTNIQGESGLDLNRDFPSVFYFKDSTINMPSTRQNTFLNLQAVAPSHFVVFQFENCEINGNYFKHDSNPNPVSTGMPLFYLDSDSSHTGHENTIRFNSCTFGTSVDPLFALGNLSTIELNNCTMDIFPDVQNWAVPIVAGQHGTIYWNNSVMRTSNQYSYNPDVNVVFNPDYQTTLMSMTQYDVIVNGVDDVTNRMFTNMTDAINYCATNGLSQPDIRLDIDLSETNIPIPGFIQNLKIYSDTKNSIVGSFEYTNLAAGQHRAEFYGVELVEAPGFELFNHGAISGGTIEFKMTDGILSTQFPLMPGSTGSITLIDVEIYNTVWNHDSAGQGGEPGFEMSAFIVPAKIFMKDSEVRITSELEAPFIKSSGTGDNENAYGTFINCTFHPNYTAPGNVPIVTGTEAFFELITDNANNGGNPNWVFIDCNVTRSNHVTFRLGGNASVLVQNSSIMTDAAQWADSWGGQVGGLLRCEDVTIGGNVGAYDFDSNITVLFNPGLAFPSAHTFIVSPEADRYPGSGNVFFTIQEGLNWAASNGHVYISVGVPSFHTEPNIAVPSTVSSITLNSYGFAGGYSFVPATLYANFLFDMTVATSATLVLNNIKMNPVFGFTPVGMYGDVTTTANGKRFFLYLRNGSSLIVSDFPLFDATGNTYTTRFSISISDSSIFVIGALAKLVVIDTDNIDVSIGGTNSTISGSNGCKGVWFDITTSVANHFSMGFRNSYIHLDGANNVNIPSDCGTVFLKTNADTSEWLEGSTRNISFNNCLFGDVYATFFEIGPDTTVSLNKCTINGHVTSAPNTEYWAKMHPDGPGGTIYANDCVWGYQSPNNYEVGLNVFFNPDFNQYALPTPYDVIVSDQTSGSLIVFPTLQEAVNYSWNVLSLQSPHIRLDIEVDELVFVPAGILNLHIHAEVVRAPSNIRFDFANTTGPNINEVHLYGVQIELADPFFNYASFTGGGAIINMYDRSHIFNEGGAFIGQPPTVNNVLFGLKMTDSSINDTDQGAAFVYITEPNTRFIWTMNRSKYWRYGTVNYPIVDAGNAFTHDHILLEFNDSSIAGGSINNSGTDIPCLSLNTSYGIWGYLKFSRCDFEACDSPWFGLSGGSNWLDIRNSTIWTSYIGAKNWATDLGGAGEIQLTNCSFIEQTDYDNTIIVTLGSNMPTPV